MYKLLRGSISLLAALSVSTGCITYGICLAYTSSAVPSLLTSQNISLSASQTTWLCSFLAIGSIFGSITSIYLMDNIGRKASLLAFAVMALFIGWTLVMAASQLWQLYLGRFLLGFGVALETTICPIYIYEVCRPSIRSICISFPHIFTSFGVFVCYVIGSNLEWNWLAISAFPFLFPFIFVLYFIPESPPWLVYNDEDDLAFKSMVLIRGEEYDATMEIRKIKENISVYRRNRALYYHERYTRNLTSSDLNVKSGQQTVSASKPCAFPVVPVPAVDNLRSSVGVYKMCTKCEAAGLAAVSLLNNEACVTCVSRRNLESLVVNSNSILMQQLGNGEIQLQKNNLQKVKHLAIEDSTPNDNDFDARNDDTTKTIKTVFVDNPMVEDKGKSMSNNDFAIRQKRKIQSQHSCKSERIMNNDDKDRIVLQGAKSYPTMTPPSSTQKSVTSSRVSSREVSSLATVTCCNATCARINVANPLLRLSHNSGQSTSDKPFNHNPRGKRRYVVKKTNEPSLVTNAQTLLAKNHHHIKQHKVLSNNVQSDGPSETDCTRCCCNNQDASVQVDMTNVQLEARNLHQCNNIETIQTETFDNTNDDHAPRHIHQHNQSLTSSLMYPTTTTNRLMSMNQVSSSKQGSVYHYNLDIHSDIVTDQLIQLPFSFRELCDKQVATPLFVMLMLTFFHQFSGHSCLLFYASIIFDQSMWIVPSENHFVSAVMATAWNDSSNSALHQDVPTMDQSWVQVLPKMSKLSVSTSTVIIGFSNFMSSIVGVFVQRNIQRRNLMLFSQCTMSVTYALLALYFYLLSSTLRETTTNEEVEEVFHLNQINLTTINKHFTTTHNMTSISNRMINNNFIVQNLLQFGNSIHLIPLFFIVIITSSFNIGIGSLTWIIANDSLPSRSKRWTSAIVNTVSFFLLFVVLHSFPTLMRWRQAQHWLPFAIYAIVCTLGFIFVLFVMPETQNKTQIQIARSYTLVNERLNSVLSSFNCLSVFASRWCGDQEENYYHHHASNNNNNNTLGGALISEIPMNLNSRNNTHVSVTSNHPIQQSDPAVSQRQCPVTVVSKVDSNTQTQRDMKWSPLEDIAYNDLDVTEHNNLNPNLTNVGHERCKTMTTQTSDQRDGYEDSLDHALHEHDLKTFKNNNNNNDIAIKEDGISLMDS